MKIKDILCHPNKPYIFDDKYPKISSEEKMLSFREYLLEGVVKTSEDQLDVFRYIVFKEILKNFSVLLGKENTNQVKTKMKELGTVRYQENFGHYGIFFENETYDVEFPLVITFQEYLPKHIGAGVSRDDYILFVSLIDSKFQGLLKSWVNDTLKADNGLKIVIEEKMSDIKHELIHLVERKIREDKSLPQLKTKSKYYVDDVSYNTSPLEHQANISNLVKKYENLLRINKEINGPTNKEQARDYVRVLLYETPKTKLPSFLLSNKETQFVEDVKSTSLKKFKELVKYFTTEAEKSILKLTKEGVVID